jgi:medium-chain acyl-[acyl-carrier-protein] hydrolase
MFSSWRRRLAEHVDLCLVHLPGRGRRMGEPPFKRLDALVEAIADVITDELQHPFAFYGHSMGAVISFELTRELRRRHGVGPQQLFLSGRRAPQMSSSKQATFNLPDEEFIAEVSKLNGTPKELFQVAETRELFLPVLRADFEIVDTYEYASAAQPLSCPITVYGGLQDANVPVESLSAWAKETHAGCKVRTFPGDHFFIHREGANFASVLGLDVAECLRGQCPPIRNFSKVETP